MSVLNVQTIYKSNVTFNNSGSGPTSNVAITSPLTGGGAVNIGGSVSISNYPASQDVNVTNASLAVTGSVDVNNFPATQDVNVTNASLAVTGSIDVNNFPATQDVNVTNASLDVSDADTHTKLDNIQTQLEKSNKGNSTLWSNNLTGVNGVSLVVNLSNVNQSNLTLYGSVNGATSLVVQFSNDGTTFYDTQYSYNQSASGDWGFNITACPLYLRLKSTNSVTAYAFVNYC